MSLLTNLFAYYPLDGNANDATGAHNGTPHSAAYVAGKIGSAFDPQNDNAHYVEFGGGGLVLGNVWSFVAWIKPTGSVGARNSLCILNADVQGFYLSSSSPAALEFNGHFFDHHLSSGTVTHNAWNHIAFVYDGATMHFYINGAASGTATFALTGANLTVDSLAGNNGVFGGFAGLVDEVGFWTPRALSAGDISDLYAAGAGIAYPFSASPPTLVSVVPDQGYLVGGASVEITGTAFVNGATVDFDGVPATGVVFNSSTSLTCTTPAHAVGLVDVTVTNPDTLTDTLADGYEYLAFPPPGVDTRVLTDYTPSADPNARDLAFNYETGAFERDSRGGLVFNRGLDSIRQAVLTSLGLILGEWFLDTTIGFPLFERVLVKSPNLPALRDLFRTRIEAVPGIVRVREITLDYNRQARTLAVTFNALSDLGEISGSITR